MAKLPKGICKIRAKGHTYFYAWRGGPRLRGEPGSLEFLQSYHEAIEERRAPDTGRFSSLVAIYKGSTAFTNLAESTRHNWHPWLDRIADYFGDLRIAQFDRPEKIRPVIRKWRDRYADRPRAADYGIEVLSRVLSYAVEQGKLADNPCEGIKSLYTGDRSDILWTEADIAQLKAAASQEVAFAVDLAAATGLRLSWSHVGAEAIMIPTGKSGHRRDAIVPLYDDLRTLLDAIPRRSTIVLTSSHGRPWTLDGFKTSFGRAKTVAGLADRGLHFHDLRGTAATRFYTAGLHERVIAEIMGWAEGQVSKIIRRYVGHTAATKAAIFQLNSAKRRT